MNRPARLLSACLACVSIGACAAWSKTGPGRERPIDALREQASKRPDDAALWSALLSHELFADGGDPARVEKTLSHVKKLKAAPLRTRFVEAELLVLAGKSGAALDAYLDTLRLARTVPDPLIASLTEASLSAVADMNDAVDDYRSRVDRVLEELSKAPATLGLNAVHQLHMQRLSRALGRGDVSAARVEAEQAGCIQRVEVAGAFGPRELLGFDQTLPGEASGPLAAEYDLGLGRGKSKKRAIETLRCVLSLGRGAHDARPGTSLMRAEIAVAKAGDYALRVESPNSIALWLDGKPLVRLDTRADPTSGVRYLPLHLSPGTHELRGKVSSRHPNPVLSLALVAATPAGLAEARIPGATGPFERYLGAKLSLARGDAVSARERLRTSGDTDPTAAVLVLQAGVSLADPLRPGELRRDHARDLLRKAAQRDPQAWYPAVGLASLEAADGRLKESIDGLRAALTRWPEVIAIRTSLIEKLKERGWVEEADALIADLGQSMPHACAVSALMLQSMRSRGRMGEVGTLTEKVMACDATATARLSLLRVERRYDDAVKELTRLRALSDVMDEAQRIDADLELALLAHDEPRIAALRAERSAFWPDRSEPVLDQVDLTLASGKREQALSMLSSAIDREPDDLFVLRNVAEALGGDNLFAGYRRDGAEVIRAFEASSRKYSEPQLLLLDYTVVRVFPDGSSADLTHNIMRVQSQESVDENGEFALPEGARLLKLHTIKADGTRLEPDAISGKNTLSLPNLSPGDYVEFEYMRGASPSTGFPGGYLGDRFYFRSFEVPFDHSELVVILPPSMEPIFDPRGPAPTTLRETRDGNTVLRWVADESRPLTPEPMSVASREFLPSINLGVRVAWSAYVESLRDLLSDKSPIDPSAAELVNAILGAARGAPASVRAALLFRWVTDQIEATQDVFGLAPGMLAARTGSRERILGYMLKLAGIESELALVRGADADHSPAKLPDPETYGYLLLKVKTEKGPAWVHTGVRHAPFGYVPAHLRGERALLLNARVEQSETPRVPLDQERRELDVAVKIATDGAATIHVRETLRGAQAINWRNDLDEVPEAQLEARFEESYVSRLLPGAALKKLNIEARNDAEAPLVLDFHFRVDKLGHRVGNEQRVGGVFLSSLSPSLARDGSRQVTELVGMSVATDLRLTVEIPEGARFVRLPSTAKLAHAGVASFVTGAREQSGKMELKRSLRVPVMRVTPGAYPEFSNFCRAVDLAEASEFGVRMP